MYTLFSIFMNESTTVQVQLHTSFHLNKLLELRFYSNYKSMVHKTISFGKEADLGVLERQNV